MNILLLFAPVHPKTESASFTGMPPVALYYLTSVLKKHGHSVRTVDPYYLRDKGFFTSTEAAEKAIMELLKEKFDAVGISANTGNWGVSRQVIEIIRGYNKVVPIIAGGIHPSYFDEYILKTTSVDYVIRGEGEVTLLSLLDALNNTYKIKEIPGISFRDKQGKIIRNVDAPLLSIEELEKYPVPEYELIPDGRYRGVAVEASRGCRFNCIFCSVYHRKSWRGLSKEIVFQRIKQVANVVKDKIIRERLVYFADDCFTSDPSHALDILNMIDQEKLGLKYAIEARATDLLTPGFIEKIPSHLIGYIQIGVEAGYNEGLKNIRKGLTIEKLEECIKLLHKVGLIEKTYLSFIMGFPWETENEVLKTVHTAGYFSQTYGLSVEINWLWFCPSDLWNLKQKYNINVNEGVFDNPLWLMDKNLFYATHPNISSDVFQRIDMICKGYMKSGCSFIYYTLGSDII